MATHTAQIVEPLLWRARLPTGNVSLADAIRDKIAKTRAHLLDFIRLDEAHPHHAMTLEEWRQPSTLQSLLATYSDHIYRNQPTLTRENKPLLSLWAQWYIGLMVPPLMLALLTQRACWNSPRNIFMSSSTRPAVRPVSGLISTKTRMRSTSLLRNVWSSS